MTVVLAFGDSNTFGYDPVEKRRMPPDVRWPGVMARALGLAFTVVEEGLRGRTTTFDDPEQEGRNGLAYFGPCLESHAPLDLVIVALGVCDTKARFAANPETIAAGAARLVDRALESSAGPEGAAPKAILVAPPPLAGRSGAGETFAGGAAKVLRLPPLYRAVAEARGIGFVDAGAFIACGLFDGVHYPPDQHAVIGAVLAEAVRMTLAS